MGCCLRKDKEELQDSDTEPSRHVKNDGGSAAQAAPRKASGGVSSAQPRHPARRKPQGLLAQKAQMAARTGSLNVSEMCLVDAPARELADAQAEQKAVTGKAPPLRIADLSSNRIQVLSPDFAALCGSLRQLMLPHNQVADLSPLLSLGQVEVLDASHNAVTALAGLGALRALRELRVSHNAIAACTDDAFGPLPRLRVIDLSHNRLSSLPSSLFALGKLDHLDVSDNELTAFGSDALVTQLKELRNLRVDRNRLSALPEALFAFTKLNQLSLDGNPLTFEQLKGMVAFDEWRKRQKEVVDKQLHGGLQAKMN